MVGTKLKKEVYQADSSNYTSNRAKYSTIQQICIHHIAAVWTAKRLGELWQDASRNGSSHYGIGNNGEIGQYVSEDCVAWTNTVWSSNIKCVTIEVSNSSTGGDWLVSDKALNTLIKLVADIAERNNLGKLVKGDNLIWHSLVYSTECPGNYLRSKMDYIVEEANRINGYTDLVIEDIENKKVVLNKDTSLWDLTFTSWSDVKSIKEFKKGDVIEVSALATHSLGGQYYLTEYSYTNEIENGFNIKDCDDYVEELIEENNETDLNGSNSNEITSDSVVGTEDTETSENDTLNSEIHQDTTNIILKILKLIINFIKNIGGKK